MQNTTLKCVVAVLMSWVLAYAYAQRTGRVEAEDSVRFLNGKIVEAARATNIVIRPHFRGTVQVGTNFYTRTTTGKLEVK